MSNPQPKVNPLSTGDVAYQVMEASMKDKDFIAPIKDFISKTLYGENNKFCASMQIGGGFLAGLGGLAFLIGIATTAAAAATAVAGTAAVATTVAAPAICVPLIIAGGVICTMGLVGSIYQQIMTRQAKIQEMEQKNKPVESRDVEQPKIEQKKVEGEKKIEEKKVERELHQKPKENIRIVKKEEKIPEKDVKKSTVEVAHQQQPPSILQMVAEETAMAVVRFAIGGFAGHLMSVAPGVITPLIPVILFGASMPSTQPANVTQGGSSYPQNIQQNPYQNNPYMQQSQFNPNINQFQSQSQFNPNKNPYLPPISDEDI